MNTLYIFKLIFNWISLNISEFSKSIKNVIFDSGKYFTVLYFIWNGTLVFSFVLKNLRDVTEAGSSYG